MIENEAYILKLKEDVITLEHFLQVAIAKLCYEIDAIEVVNGLALGNQHFDHTDNIGMFAVLQQNYLSKYSPSLRQGLE